MSIRVVIAEDQAMVRGALAALLAIEADIEIAGEARDGREALDLVLRTLPDVLLTDIEMPEATGLELAAEIQRRKLPVRVAIPPPLPAPAISAALSILASPAISSRTPPQPPWPMPSVASAPAPAWWTPNWPLKPGPKPTP